SRLFVLMLLSVYCISPLSLHDSLPSSGGVESAANASPGETHDVSHCGPRPVPGTPELVGDPIPGGADPASDRSEGAPDVTPGEVQNGADPRPGPVPRTDEAVGGLDEYATDE